MRRANPGLVPVIVVALLLSACGPEATPSPATPKATASASKAPADQPVREQRVGSEKLLDRRQRNALASDTLDQVKSVSVAPPKTAADIYKTVAPATVIIRVPNGLGSGIIIDPEGWVLTNHHVIANGKTDDFSYKASVLIGDLSAETGGMERSDKVYEADIYKTDKLRDIALLKIKDPPENLPAIEISGKNPVPGDAITALGHAGAGMLWAIKTCQIAAIGKLTEHLANLASFKDDENGKKALERFKKFMESQQLGMVIQSTCNILPGDSGGPVVSARGELVGLNVFTRRDRRTGGLLSFHVHLAEIQNFLKERPTKPAQLLPDPWREGGGDLSLEDADLDGRVDALMMQGRKPCRFCPRQSTAVFFDIDQNSLAEGASTPDLNDVFDKRSFEAEAVFLQLGRDVLVWYDTDNDGDYDVLFRDERARGMVSAAYRINDDGVLEKSEELSTGRTLRSKLFADEKLHDRFTRIARAAFPKRYTDASNRQSDKLPEPIGHTGRGSRIDLNRDGTADALDITSAFSKRLLIDVDSNFVPKLSKTTHLGKADTSKFDPEATLVSQSDQMWVWYDRDNDGRFDLALHSPGSRLYVAADAWNVDADGNKTSAPEHIGRKLVRPALLKNPDLAAGMRSMVKRGLLAIMSAKDNDGLASFPHPAKDHRGAGFKLLDLKAAPRTVVTVVAQGSDGYLIDLDRSSRLFGPISKIKIDEKIKNDKFETEFAYFQRNGIAWAFYDTRNTGTYDLVLLSTKPATGIATAGFRISKDGEATYDAALGQAPLVRPKLFKQRRLSQRMKKIAPDLFAETMVEQ